MKQEELNKRDPFKSLIQEAGIETLGAEFHGAVLSKIEVLPKGNPSYTPVISSKGWKLIFGFIAFIYGTSVFFIPESEDSPSLFDKIPSIDFPKFSFALNNISMLRLDFSPPFLLSIVAFFILGFIMIAGTIRNTKVRI